MYLPFNENWPVSIYNNYSPSYWIDEAVSESYRDKLKTAFKQFAVHINKKKWNNTIFQFYLNNKVYHRKSYKKSSAPWIFDEPVNTQDFWALRWFGLVWKEAVSNNLKYNNLIYRGDISYTQFGRNILWGVMDMEYIGQINSQKIRMKKDEQDLFDSAIYSEYGTLNKINTANTQAALWCLSAWSNGSTGILPWQSIGTRNSWEIADQTALIYPHKNGPLPSLRLKALLRGQQDVEYLEMFCKTFEKPQWVVASWLKKQLNFELKTIKSYYGDAGTPVFLMNDAGLIWKLRHYLGKMISSKSPDYQRKLKNMKKINTSIKRIPQIGYSKVSPKNETIKPKCDNFKFDN